MNLSQVNNIGASMIISYITCDLEKTLHPLTHVVEGRIKSKKIESPAHTDTCTLTCFYLLDYRQSSKPIKNPEQETTAERQ